MLAILGYSIEDIMHNFFLSELDFSVCQKFYSILITTISGLIYRWRDLDLQTLDSTPTISR